MSDINEVHIQAKDHDTLLDMCDNIDTMTKCWSCPRFDEIFGRQVSCKIHESNFNTHIKNNGDK